MTQLCHEWWQIVLGSLWTLVTHELDFQVTLDVYNCPGYHEGIVNLH